MSGGFHFEVREKATGYTQHYAVHVSGRAEAEAVLKGKRDVEVIEAVAVSKELLEANNVPLGEIRQFFPV